MTYRDGNAGAPPRHRARMHGVLDADELQRLCVVADELITTAIRTDRALPDRERRWLRTPQCGLPDPEPDQRLAYDSEGAKEDAARAARFRPTPAEVARYLPVMGWLTWLKRQNDGARDLRILIMRATGAPMWAIAERFGRSDDTIRRWEAGAIATIVNRYWREISAMDAEDRRRRQRERETKGWERMQAAERRHRGRRGSGR